jgi:hypothetical protein
MFFGNWLLPEKIMTDFRSFEVDLNLKQIKSKHQLLYLNLK